MVRFIFNILWRKLKFFIIIDFKEHTFLFSILSGGYVVHIKRVMRPIVAHGRETWSKKNSKFKCEKNILRMILRDYIRKR